MNFPTYLALPAKPLLLSKTASEGDLARSETIALSLSEASETSSNPSRRGDVGGISTTVGQDMPLSIIEVRLSVGVDSEL